MGKVKYNQSIIGDKYGKLTVLSLYSNINYRKKFNCLCECGNETIVAMSHLRTGHTKSCGCTIGIGNTKHGYSKTRLYTIYYAMIGRCHNPQDSRYSKYGAKGISVCLDWRDDFLSFKEWAEANGYKSGLTIDRSDSRLGYSPDNCRWVDYSTQAINKLISIRNTSGHVGVFFHKAKGKWIGRVVHDGKVIETGASGDLDTAVELRKQYILTHNLTKYIEAMKYENS